MENDEFSKVDLIVPTNNINSIAKRLDSMSLDDKEKNSISINDIQETPKNIQKTPKKDKKIQN